MKKLMLFFAFLALGAGTLFAQVAISFDPTLLSTVTVETAYTTNQYEKNIHLQFETNGDGTVSYANGATVVKIPFKGLVPIGDFEYALQLPKSVHKKGLVSVTITRNPTFEEALFKMEGVKWLSAVEGRKCGWATTPLKETYDNTAIFICPENGCADAGEITVTRIGAGTGWDVRLPDGRTVTGKLNGKFLQTGEFSIQLFFEGGTLKKKPRP